MVRRTGRVQVAMYSPEDIQGLQDLLMVSSQAEAASPTPALSL